MDPTKPRGRGRGRGRGKLATPSATADEAASSSISAAFIDLDGDTDQIMADAPAASSSSAAVSAKPPFASATGSSRRLSSTTAGTSGGKPVVGGLLAGSEYAKKPATKLKFVPNMKRKPRVVPDDDDDFDVKMEEVEQPFAGRGRGRGRGRGGPRAEIEMTASGPMAHGPGGDPRATSRGASFGGVAVMNSSRTSGTGGGGGGGGGSSHRSAKGQFDDSGEPDPDDSDLEIDEDDGVFRVRARDLNDIAAEDEMAPMILPRDPKVVRSALDRRRERTTARIKLEAPKIKPDPEDDLTPFTASSTVTPALETDSKASTLELKDFEMEDDKKVPLFDADLREDFDVPDPGRERLYMFQFPRKFPSLINALHVDVPPAKPEHVEGSVAPKVQIPPPWGRAGPRASKAARWPTEQGRVGELCVHKSGKVTLWINNDLQYEVLPAAQPSFLQEVAILDHDPATVPGVPGGEPAMSSPTRALVMMGQTTKKFIVVPEATHLLDKIQAQEKAEKEAAKEEARRKAALKKEKN